MIHHTTFTLEEMQALNNREWRPASPHPSPCIPNMPLEYAGEYPDDEVIYRCGETIHKAYHSDPLRYEHFHLWYSTILVAQGLDPLAVYCEVCQVSTDYHDEYED
jgi:hypothetical protein